MKHSFFTILILMFFAAGCASKKEVASAENQNTPDNISASERDKILFQEYFFSGNKEKMLGNRQASAEYFQKALKLNPKSAVVWFELAMLSEANNNFTEATAFAEKAVELDPTNKWYLLLLNDFYTSAKNYSGAINTINKLIEINPEALEYYYELASVYLMQNDFKKSLAVYDKLEEKYGVNETVNTQKQKIYSNINDKESAIKEIKKLVTAYPGQVQYYGMLAELYIQNNQPEEALSTYQKINDIDPNNPYVQLSLAEYYERAGKKEKGRESLKNAFQNPNLDIDAKIKILLNFFNITEKNKDDLEYAFLLNQINVGTHPDNPKAYAMYGDFLYRENLLDSAENMYNKALSLDANRYLIWNQLLMINSEQNNNDGLVKNSQKAMELFPNLPGFYFFNGVGHYQNQNYTQAINAFETGKEFVFDNPPLQMQFYSNLGDCYYAVHNFKQAFLYYEKALEIEPNNAYVLNNYSYYLSELGENLEKAEKMSKKSNELAPNNPSYLDTYAWILYKQQNYTDAKIYMEKAFDAGGKNNATLLDHYADILFRLGKTDEAKTYWQKAFDKDPNLKGLKQKLEKGTLNNE